MPHFLAALHATSESHAMMTGPALLLKKFQRTFDLHLMPNPLDIPATHIELVWHEFKDSDPGLSWLSRQLEEIANSLE